MAEYKLPTPGNGGGAVVPSTSIDGSNGKIMSSYQSAQQDRDYPRPRQQQPADNNSNINSDSFRRRESNSRNRGYQTKTQPSLLSSSSTASSTSTSKNPSRWESRDRNHHNSDRSDDHDSRRATAADGGCSNNTDRTKGDYHSNNHYNGNDNDRGYERNNGRDGDGGDGNGGGGGDGNDSSGRRNDRHFGENEKYDDYRPRDGVSQRKGRTGDGDGDHRYNMERNNGDRHHHDDNHIDNHIDNHDDRRRERRRYEDNGDGGNRDTERYRSSNRDRSDTSGYYSDDDYHHDSRRSERSRRGDDRRRSPSRDRDRDRRRRSNKDYDESDDNNNNYADDYDYDYDYDYEEKIQQENNEIRKKKPTEWPPSFQNDGSAFTFDTRSAMFYEPLSNFFYDPKSKLYYGNKKFAYFRYDETKKPPFVEVQKMTTKELEQQGVVDGGGAILAQEKVPTTNNNQASMIPSKPKIAIKLKTKKVKSSLTTIAAIEGTNQHTGTAATVSKVKKQQIANIGKWTEKQAELKKNDDDPAAATNTETASGLAQQPQPQTKVRTTAKGEPICGLCKRKFPNLEKLRLHEKGSELHKKNLLKLQEKKKQKDAAGTKRKLEEKNITTNTANDDANPTATATADGAVATTAATTAPAYTDRAHKRRQLHGVDLCAPANGIPSLRRQDAEPELPLELRGEPSTNAPGSDLLDDETNVGHQMLQRMGYKFGPSSVMSSDHQQQQQQQNADSGRPKTANEHLRKEWDRIEAMAAKSVPRNRSKY